MSEQEQEQDNELWDVAISEGSGSEAYDNARKLTALALVEDNPEMSGEEAAVYADHSLFRKTVDVLVGIGDMNAEDAVQRLIDRAHATATAFIQRTLPTAVRVGCAWLGRTIGAVFGPSGIAVGGAIGTWLGNVLNEDVTTLVRKGVDMIRDAALGFWGRLKARLIEKGREIKQIVVNRVTASLA